MCVALALALGWGAIEATAFADQLDAIAEAIGLRAQLRRTAVPGDAIAPMARNAVAIRRLIDPTRAMSPKRTRPASIGPCYTPLSFGYFAV
jgi:hypothetical protein